MNNNQNSTNNINYKHGETNTRLYVIWRGIKIRCLNTKFKDYIDYGGRGITICPEWTNDYVKFRDWSLSNGYKENLEIDHIDNNGNYEPSNCRFITGTKNRRNTRKNRIKSIEQANEIRVSYNSGNYVQRELSQLFDVSQELISYVVNNKIWK